MSQRTGGIRRPLRHPGLYSLAQRMLGAERVQETFVREHLRPRTGERVLDLGSGPGDIVALLGEVEYVGVDHSAAYVAAGRSRHGPRARFVQADVRDATDVAGTSFDAVISIGVLHHLDDAGAAALLAGAAAALRPGGRLVTLDPAWAPEQPRLARWLIARDRGQAVRSLAGYEDLGRRSFADVHGQVRCGLARVPYTHAFVEYRSPHPVAPQ